MLPALGSARQQRRQPAPMHPAADHTGPAGAAGQGLGAAGVRRKAAGGGWRAVGAGLEAAGAGVLGLVFAGAWRGADEVVAMVTAAVGAVMKPSPAEAAAACGGGAEGLKLVLQLGWRQGQAEWEGEPGLLPLAQLPAAAAGAWRLAAGRPPPPPPPPPRHPPHHPPPGSRAAWLQCAAWRRQPGPQQACWCRPLQRRRPLDARACWPPAPALPPRYRCCSQRGRHFLSLAAAGG